MAGDCAGSGRTNLPKELLMLTVEYLPGGASLPRRHETFYEDRTDVHVVSANASKTAAAKILVFIVKDKSAPVSRAAASKGAS
jgi:hypothetical protein